MNSFFFFLTFVRLHNTSIFLFGLSSFFPFCLCLHFLSFVWVENVFLQSFYSGATIYIEGFPDLWKTTYSFFFQKQGKNEHFQKFVEFFLFSSNFWKYACLGVFWDILYFFFLFGPKWIKIGWKLDIEKFSTAFLKKSISFQFLKIYVSSCMNDKHMTF